MNTKPKRSAIKPDQRWVITTVVRYTVEVDVPGDTKRSDVIDYFNPGIMHSNSSVVGTYARILRQPKRRSP